MAFIRLTCQQATAVASQQVLDVAATPQQGFYDVAAAPWPGPMGFLLRLLPRKPGCCSLQCSCRQLNRVSSFNHSTQLICKHSGGGGCAAACCCSLGAMLTCRCRCSWLLPFPHCCHRCLSCCWDQLPRQRTAELQAHRWLHCTAASCCGLSLSNAAVPLMLPPPPLLLLWPLRRRSPLLLQLLLGPSHRCRTHNLAAAGNQPLGCCCSCY